MKIAIGCDHGGLHLKQEIKELLSTLGHEVEDFGTHSTESCDYPDIAEPVAHAVVDGAADRGILICGTGIGIGIAANKIAGVRAALCHDLHFPHMRVGNIIMPIFLRWGNALLDRALQRILLRFGLTQNLKADVTRVV